MASTTRVINSDLQKGRVEPDPQKRTGYYEDLNRQFSKQLYNIWINWTVWDVSTSPKVHGIFGPQLPDGSAPNPGLATGHSMAGLFVTQ